MNPLRILIILSLLTACATTPVAQAKLQISPEICKQHSGLNLGSQDVSEALVPHTWATLIGKQEQLRGEQFCACAVRIQLAVLRKGTEEGNELTESGKRFLEHAVQYLKLKGIDTAP